MAEGWSAGRRKMMRGKLNVGGCGHHRADPADLCVSTGGRAVSPDSAIPESEVPWSQKWYYGRLIDYGAVKRVGGRCYLDERLAQAYLRDWRKRGFRFVALAVLAFAVLWSIWALIS